MQAPQREHTLLEADCFGAAIRVPLITLRGSDDGPRLAVVAGVHGSEYSGIVAAMRLSELVAQSTLRGTLTIVPICNPPAFYGRSEAICPIDGKNLNRVFPGNPSGTYSDRLAHLVFSDVVEHCDCLLNVHGGDIFEALLPYAGFSTDGEAALANQCRELGHVYDVPYVVTFAGKSSTSYGLDLNTAAQQRGIPALLVEAGGQGVLEEEYVQFHLKGMTNIMKHLGMLKGDIQRDNATRDMTSDFWRLPQEGVFLPSVKLGEHVEKDQPIGTLFNVYGQVEEELRAPQPADILAIVTTPAGRKGAVMYQVVY